MNPPFTGGQDAEHVMHAFELLNLGGRLVAIVGDGICTRSDKKATEFQVFMKKHFVLEERLNNGEFKESGTLSNSRIIVLDKV
jgi:16S rRNA G1207 methylase RsmC